MALNVVFVWSLVMPVQRSILGCMPTRHVLNKLPYIGLLPQTQLGEVASCTLLAEMLPQLRCSPDGLV